jgi:hypothetical protein
MAEWDAAGLRWTQRDWLPGPRRADLGHSEFHGRRADGMRLSGGGEWRNSRSAAILMGGNGRSVNRRLSLRWFEPNTCHTCDLSRHRGHREPALGARCFRLLGAGWPAGGLVVAAGVEGELAEQLAGGCVDDADVQVLDEQQDGLAGVLAASADVAELAGVAEGEGSGGPVAGCGFGPGGAGGGGDRAVGQGPVRPWWLQ